jgi:hypothetical protein
MERVSAVFFVLPLLVFLGVPAHARPPKTAEAVLAVASGAEARQVIDGRAWRCLGTGCKGRSVSAPKSQPILYECRSVAAAFGELALYRSGGRTLDAETLAQCNTAAAPRTRSGELARSR